MSRVSVSVVTSTYNRRDKLGILYESLKRQTVVGFDWIIIDDGSTDDTAEYVESIMRKKNSFKIIYKRKNNGGKHTALNMAFDIVEDGLIVIVDSDDYLIDSAIETIISDWQKYGKKNLSGLCYKRMSSNDRVIVKDFGKGVTISSYGDFIINDGRKGETTEVFCADALANWRFPEYKGEKFLAEGALWAKITKDRKMVFIDKAICVCEYYEDGLTMSGRKLRIDNPLGGMYCTRDYLGGQYRLRLREKKALLFLVYARFAGKNIMDECKKNGNSAILYLNLLPSLILYHYWAKKYKVRRQ